MNVITEIFSLFFYFSGKKKRDTQSSTQDGIDDVEADDGEDTDCNADSMDEDYRNLLNS